MHPAKAESVLAELADTDHPYKRRLAIQKARELAEQIIDETEGHTTRRPPRRNWLRASRRTRR